MNQVAGCLASQATNQKPVADGLRLTKITLTKSPKHRIRENLHCESAFFITLLEETRRPVGTLGLRSIRSFTNGWSLLSRRRSFF